MSDSRKALRELRARRKKNRLGEFEWFEAAYRVYIFGFFGGGVLLWVSGAIGDGEVTASRAADLLERGPAVLGLLAVLALVAGLRSGSQGGPIALESADVAYVMLAPVDRRSALFRPAYQRVRSALFAGAGLGAALGQMAGRRLPGTALAWAGSGALYGLVVAGLWVGGALVAHMLHMRLWTTSVIAVGLFTWQGLAIGKHIAGPADTAGDLAFWGWRQDGIDVLPIAAVAVLIAIGMTLLARTSLDALARRSNLVAQLRFAVTMQDLRTVVLLRRQLNYEQTRTKPWVRMRVGHGRTAAVWHGVWRRGWHSLFRLPVSRLLRMAVVAGAAGACQVAVFRGTTTAILGSTVLLFVLGLEVLEPLSQEVDQPDRTDSFPIARGDLMSRHLLAPAVALIPFAIIGGATAAIVDGRSGAIGVAAILALPTVLAGAAGAAVSVVRDAPDPFSSSNQQTFMPPEMAGFSTVARTLIPLVVSAIGALTILLVRSTVRLNGPDAALGGALRASTMAILVIAATATWVRMRDRIRMKIRGFMDDGRNYSKGGAR